MEKKDNNITLHGSLWITVGGENFGGHGRIALLTQIAECGSISQAARNLKMSYKAAWDAVDAMNNLAGEPLVERLTGGKGGGGTRLTQRGEQLIENFNIIEREHRRFIEQLSQQTEGIADDYLLIRRMAMKTSARNQFFGKITAIKQGVVNDEIELETANKQKIVAIVTHESTENLELSVGSEVFALVKSSSIIVLIDGDNESEGTKTPLRLSARNRLEGKITRLLPGAVNTEVVIDLSSGASVVAVVTNGSSQSLGLQVGQPATAVFKASSVIVGVPA